MTTRHYQRSFFGNIFATEHDDFLEETGQSGIREAPNREMGLSEWHVDPGILEMTFAI